MPPTPPRKPNPTPPDDADAWTRAPRTSPEAPPLDTEVALAQPPGHDAEAPAGVPGEGPVAAGTRLARELADAFRGHVRRAIGAGLDDSETSLAFVDHYLRTVRSESRAPILALIAAEAGAYYGELVCATMGATWIGDGRDPRRLRLLLRDQFLHFSPVDQAFEALLGPLDARTEPLELAADDDDEIHATRGPTLDTTFHARRKPARVGAAVEDAADEPDDDPSTDRERPDDASWLAERLAELPEVGEFEFYSLTCRFETLKLVLELLATKHVGEGKSPREYHIADYIEALAQRD